MGTDDLEFHDQQPDDLGFPVAGQAYPADAPDLSEPMTPPEREPTVMEMMNAPARPDAQTTKTFIWVALTFVTALLALTFAEITLNGVDWISLLTIAVLCLADYVLVGMLRYKGEDPMKQFDPPKRETPNEPSSKDRPNPKP